VPETKITIELSNNIYLEARLQTDHTASDVIDELIVGDYLSNDKQYRFGYILTAGDRINRLIQKANNHFVVLDTESFSEGIDMDADPRKVFVVHGRNVELKRELFTFLREINLSPIEWEEAVNATGSSPFVGEVLETGFKMAKAVIVLMTGDDEAKLRDEYLSDNDPPEESELTPQPRQNVMFEAGMAMGTHPNETILIEVGNLRNVSDLSGRHTIRLNNSAEKRQALIKRLEAIGCEVNINGTGWLTIGNFEN